MTDTTKQAVTALLDGVTPGPWNYSPWHIEEAAPAVRSQDGWIVCTTAPDADARFIAAARDLVPALLAERDALAAQLADAETRARESALDALAAYGQAADAHEAQLAAEADAASWKMAAQEAEKEVAAIRALAKGGAA